MKVGITGSTGVIGRAILERWQGVEFFPFRGDIRNRKDVKDWYETVKPLSAIIHLAAVVPVQTVQNDPIRALEVNVLGTGHVLEVIREGGGELPWIFYCSSSHVYASSSDKLGEDAPLSPITIYGQTKLQGEKWAEIYRNEYKMPVCVGRVFSYSSARQPESYFIPSMIKKIKAAPHGGTLEVRGLEGSRDFLTTNQIVEAIKFLFEKGCRDTVNIGTGASTRLGEIVESLKARLQRSDVKIKSVSSETNYLVADTRKLNGLGLELQFNMEQFLDTILVQK